MPITLEIVNDRITPALQRMAGAVENPLGLFQEFGEHLVKSTTDRFATGRAPSGSVWAPKSPATLAAGGGRKTGPRDTRPLFGPWGSLSSTIAYAAFDDRVEWGSPMVYAAMQQFGGRKAVFPHLWGDIPARPFIGISDEDETALLDAIAEWLEGAATGGA